MSDKPSGLARAAARMGYSPSLDSTQRRTLLRRERLAPGTKRAGQQNVKVNMQDPLTRFLLAHGVGKR